LEIHTERKPKRPVGGNTSPEATPTGGENPELVPTVVKKITIAACKNMKESKQKTERREPKKFRTANLTGLITYGGVEIRMGCGHYRHLVQSTAVKPFPKKKSVT